MKRIKLILLISTLVLLLCGCCLRHDWQSADCERPVCCSKCGAVKGQPLGHSWQEADCLRARCCLSCGLSEGAPLGHDWQDGLCSRCGLPRSGSAVTPDFERYGISTALALNEQFPFTTATRDEPSLLTTGTATVTGFGLIPPDAVHTAREGYEWLYVVIQISFFDTNARSYGVSLMTAVEDYYDLQLRGSTEHVDEDGMTVYSVLKNGERMECRYRRESLWSGWQQSVSGRRENVYSTLWEIEQPVGYDGTVVGIYSSEINWEYGQYIDQVYDAQKFLLFRLG